MHEVAVLAIWFSSIIAGMVVTMLMPHILQRHLGAEGSKTSWFRCLQRKA